MAEANWYVVHTYSGYENKVKANIEKTIENRHLEEQILEVRVPMQDVVEMKNGARKQVQKKLFPGYVLINMVMNDDTWYVVRNTRGVTGFVGPGSKPVPLTEEEMRPLGIEAENVVKRMRKLREATALIVHTLHTFENKTIPCRAYRRQSRGEYKASGFVYHEAFQPFVHYSVCSASTESFPHSAHYDVYLATQSLLLHESEPARSYGSYGVGFIHIQGLELAKKLRRVGPGLDLHLAHQAVDVGDLAHL